MDLTPDPVVRTTAGPVRGTRTPGVTAFLGIPYAAPAVGRARFAAPVRAPAWQAPRDATAHGPTALQGPYPPPMDRLLPSSVAPGEDYLNVSVWTPDPAASALPVIVWVHGGAFVRGAASIPTYDGSAFARDGVVLVGINYRIGLPGFAVLPDAPQNLGIRDQILALQWVQENIAAFGGDPGRVTIMGESAGGMSVATLLGSPAAQGLFSAAIMQSGNATTAADPDDARRVGEAVAERLGVAATAEALSDVDPAALLAAQTQVGAELATNPDPGRWGASVVRGGLGIMSYFPTIDGEVVPDLPLASVRQGSSAGIPLLTGTTAEEFRLFTVPTGLAAAVTDEVLPLLLARYGWDSSVARRYAANRPGAGPGDVVSAMLTDAGFRAPTAALASAQHATGADVFVYELGWATPVDGLGACHALDLGFVFDTLDQATGSVLLGPHPPQSLADTMHRAWVDFATGHDPGWPVYRPGERAVMRFDEASEVVTDPRPEELDWLLPAP